MRRTTVVTRVEDRLAITLYSLTCGTYNSQPPAVMFSKQLKISRSTHLARSQLIIKSEGLGQESRYVCIEDTIALPTATGLVGDVVAHIQPSILTESRVCQAAAWTGWNFDHHRAT